MEGMYWHEWACRPACVRGMHGWMGMCGGHVWWACVVGHIVLQRTGSRWILAKYMHSRCTLYFQVEHPSKWLGQLWRTKGSDFKSVVYMSELVFSSSTSYPYLELSSRSLEASSQSSSVIRNSYRLSSVTPRLIYTQCHTHSWYYSEKA